MNNKNLFVLAFAGILGFFVLNSCEILPEFNVPFFNFHVGGHHEHGGEHHEDFHHIHEHHHR